MLSHGVISSNTNLCRHQAQDEAARLKVEILRRGDELAELEKLAGSVSSSRQASKLGIHERSSNGAVSTTEVSTQLPSSSKLIEQLQKEIDHLKLAREAAIQSFVSEKRAKDILKLKYDDLESNMTSLRTQSNNYVYQIRRNDQTLAAGKDTIEDLRVLLVNSQEKSMNSEEIICRQNQEIEKLKHRISAETSHREKIEQEYSLLSSEHKTLRIQLGRDVKSLREELDSVKTQFLSETMQVRSAKEEIILLNEKQCGEIQLCNLARKELADVRDEQFKCLLRTVHTVARDVERNLTHHDIHKASIRSLQQQLEDLCLSLTVCAHDQT